jgi:hypothetical protein
MGEGRRIPALAGATNYNYWIGLMRAQLLIDKTWSIVQGTRKRPTDRKSVETDAELSDRQDEWDELNNNAMGVILKHLSEGPMNMVQDKTTASDIWEELRKTYQLKGYSARHIVWNRLMRSELTQFSSISEYGENMKKGMIELNSLSEAPYQEWQVTSIFLHGLGSEWDPIVNSIIYSIQEQARNKSSPTSESGTRSTIVDEPSFHEVLQRVLDYERRQGQDERQNSTKALSAGKSDRNGQKKSSQRKKRHCTGCGRDGHTDEGCYSLHPEKAPEWFKNKTTADYMALQVTPVTQAGRNQKEDVWYMDSGAYHHLCWNRSRFTTYQASSGAVQLADGRSLECQGIGTVTLKIRGRNGKIDLVTVRNVRHIPDLQEHLLSLGSIESQGNEIAMKNGKCIVTRTKDRVVLATGTRIGNGRLYLLSEVHDTKANALAVTSFEKADLHIWHRRLGHLNMDAVQRLATQVDGMKIRERDEEHRPRCGACIQGKQHRIPSRDPMTRATTKLGLIHVDLGGGGNITPSVGGAKYYMIITDDLTRYRWVYFLKYKSEASEKLKDFATWIENQEGIKIKRVRSDGGELDSIRTRQWSAGRGIQWEYTVPYAPDQNGVAERSMRTIMSKTRTTIIDSHLNESLWAEVMDTIVYLTNRSPTKSVADGSTPYEAWTGKKPNLGHLRMIGCTAYIHIPKHKGKLQPRSWKGQFIGYVSDNIYKIWDPERKQVHRARDVEFLEEIDGIHSIEQSDGEESEGDDEELTVQNSCTPDRTPNQRENDHVRSPSPTPSEDSVLSHITVEIAEPEQARPESLSRTAEDVAGRPSLRPIPRTNYRKLHEGAFAVKEGSVSVPQNFEEAMQSPDARQWKEAMDSEIQSLKENVTWNLVPLPAGRRAIKGRWVYSLKDGGRFKARWVAKGFEQQYGIDYEQTYASVVRAFRTIFALAALHGWDIQQMDAVTAFLNSSLPTTHQQVYVEQPHGYEVGILVCLLLKALYGLKQSPRAWYETVERFLFKNGYQACTADGSIFVNKEKRTIIALFVDDILITGLDETEIERAKDHFKAEYKMKDMGNISKYLGLDVTQSQNKTRIQVSQATYILEILDAYGFKDCKPVGTPMEPGIVLQKSDTEVDMKLQQEYQRAIGSLMYTMVQTRPDIAYAVSTLAQYSSNPNHTHWTAVKRIFRYLKGTLSLGIEYSRDARRGNELVGYSDADYAGDRDNRRSTSGFVFMLAGGPITWASRKQLSVALSTCEAEYMAMSKASTEAMWLRKLLHEVDFSTPSTPPQTNLGIKIKPMLYADNQGAIALTENPVFHNKTKHVENRYHYIRERVAEGSIAVKYISTDNMIADGLTKPLSRIKFQRFVQQVGLKEIGTSEG